MKKQRKSLLFIMPAVILVFGIASFTACKTGKSSESGTSHEYDDGVVTTPATCTEDGVKTFTCTAGDDTYTEAIPALGHKYKNGVCTRCGEKQPTSDEYFTFNYLSDTDSYEIKAKNAKNMPAEVVIPSKHEGKPVTSICYYAFRSCSSLTSIVLPSSVTSIGYAAFWSCISLTSIVLPSSVTSIDNFAFVFCSNLTSIVLPSSVTSIGGQTFQGCRSLTSIVLPSSVTSIGSYAFYNCSSLTSVTFEEGSKLTSIGDDAFSGCSSLTNIVLPSSVTSIGNRAFDGCNSLKSIVLPSSVTSIGDGPFKDCSSLTSIKVEKGNTNYKSIDGNLYSYDGKTLIQYAIGKNDMSFNIPSSVSSIGSYAFEYCSSLTSIVLPSSVTSIGSYAFVNCYGLYKVINHSDINLTFESKDNGYLARYAGIIVNKNGNATYKDGWSETLDGFVFDTDNNKYRLRAYYGDKTTVTLPLTYNGQSYDIYYFRGATKVIIPEGFTSIGSYAFWGCISLTNIVLPSSVTSIGHYAFYSCSSLTSINFKGTMAQWKAVSKGTNWNYNMPPDYKVICTDGNY